jgi:hypothetical protein
MFPQQFQTSPFSQQGVFGATQPFASQGAWGAPQQFAPQGISFADILNIATRILPLLSLQAGMGMPSQLQSSMGFPSQQQFAPQGLWGNLVGQLGPMLPFQTGANMPQGGGFGSGQFAPQGLNLIDIINTITRILPLLSQQAGAASPQSSGFGYPYQQFAPQGINPIDVINLIGRLLPYFGQQTSQSAGVSSAGPGGVGSSPYIH